MDYFGTSFSIQMLDTSTSSTVTVTPITLEDVKNMKLYSVIGHADTANILTRMLGKSVPVNRESIRLAAGDVLVVAQIVGGRLPEGATSLPPRFKIVFIKVMVKD